MTRPNMERVRAAALLALGVALAGVLLPRSAQAQRLGLEAGVAGAENQEMAPALGISAFAPLTHRLHAVANYTRWTACDEVGCDGGGYGNEGVNLLALYRLLDSRALSAGLGGGLGWYERFRDDGGRTDKFWESALSLAAELRRVTAYNSDVYLRGEVSFPSDDHIPRWGMLRLGVDVSLF